MTDRILELADGQRMGIAEYGDPAGFPLIALHGAPASRLIFSIADAPAHRRGLRLIAPDRPGYGLTPLDPEPRTLVGRAGGIRSLADALGLDSLAVLGVSGGGPTAAATAALLGARVSVLALVSPVGPMSGSRDALARGYRFFFLDLPRHPRLLRRGAQVAAGAFRLAPGFFARVFARTLGGADRLLLSQPAMQAALIFATREALRGGGDGAVADLQMYSAPWVVALDAIRAPTLLWQGSDDVVIPPEAFARLAAAIPGCRLVRLEGAGHFWVMEHADDILAAIGRIVRPAGNSADV